jgi:hypothetical protein
MGSHGGTKCPDCRPTDLYSVNERIGLPSPVIGAPSRNPVACMSISSREVNNGQARSERRNPLC